MRRCSHRHPGARRGRDSKDFGALSFVMPGLDRVSYIQPTCFVSRRQLDGAHALLVPLRIRFASAVASAMSFAEIWIQGWAHSGSRTIGLDTVSQSITHSGTRLPVHAANRRRNVGNRLLRSTRRRGDWDIRGPLQSP
jgi:hypothetical protein